MIFEKLLSEIGEILVLHTLDMNIALVCQWIAGYMLVIEERDILHVSLVSNTVDMEWFGDFFVIVEIWRNQCFCKKEIAILKLSSERAQHLAR